MKKKEEEDEEEERKIFSNDLMKKKRKKKKKYTNRKFEVCISIEMKGSRMTGTRWKEIAEISWQRRDCKVSVSP